MGAKRTFVTTRTYRVPAGTDLGNILNNRNCLFEPIYCCDGAGSGDDSGSGDIQPNTDSNISFFCGTVSSGVPIPTRLYRPLKVRKASFVTNRWQLISEECRESRCDGCYVGKSVAEICNECPALRDLFIADNWCLRSTAFTIEWWSAGTFPYYYNWTVPALTYYRATNTVDPTPPTAPPSVCSGGCFDDATFVPSWDLFASMTPTDCGFFSLSLTGSMPIRGDGSLCPPGCYPLAATADGGYATSGPDLEVIADYDCSAPSLTFLFNGYISSLPPGTVRVGSAMVKLSAC